MFRALPVSCIALPQVAVTGIMPHLMTFRPWTFFAVAIAGWMNRRQQEAIEYLRIENRILREKLGHKRIILNVSQKRQLAVAAFKLPRDLLRQCGTLFSPETILKWHRMLIARKYDGSGKRGPKPKKANSVRKLVKQMSEENPSWGYGRICGELRKLGFKIHWQTVRRVMLDLGLLPDPDRPYKTTWKTFIQSHWESIAAADFFTTEAWGIKGLTRYLVLFVIDISTRRVQIVGIHADPCETQMIQWARNLTDAQDGFLKGKRILIHDRDPLFTEKFRATLKAVGVRCLKMPRRSPNLNSYAESFVRTIKREALDRMVLFGERSVRHVIEQYIEHYLGERPHKGLDYHRPVEPDESPPAEGQVACRERLGGLLKSYYREAA
jgi:transposase InsO family protein